MLERSEPRSGEIAYVDGTNKVLIRAERLRF